MSENVELVKRSIVAYSGRDFEALRGMNHPELKLDWSRSRGLEAGVYQGVEDVIGFYRNFLDTFEKIAIEPDRFIESGDSVVVPNTAYIRGRDGIETVARSAFIFELRGGLITRICLHQEITGSPRSRRAAGVGDVRGER